MSDEVRRGDWVAWDRREIAPPSYKPVVVGQVLRVARDQSWADIRYLIPEQERGELAIAWGITHRTLRVKVRYLQRVGVSDDGVAE